MKKKSFDLKKLLVILMIMTVAFVTFAVASAAEEESIPGLTVKRQEDSSTTTVYPDTTYSIEKYFDKFPETVEAWVYVPSSIASSDIGVILGNSEARGVEGSVNFEIIAGAIPRILIKNNYDSSYDISFTESTLPTDRWTQLTLVYDNTEGIAACYIDGELSEEKYFYPSFNHEVLIHKYIFGGDNRQLNKNWFKGGLGDMTVYSDVRTADEIKSDYLKGLEMTKAELDSDNVILYYDVDENDIGKSIADDSGNGYDALCSKMWITEEEMEEMRKNYGFEPSYSFAIVGDTQKTVRWFPRQIPKLYQWIVDNVEKRNIKYCIGLGDITDKSGLGTDSKTDDYTFIEDASAPGGGYYVIDKTTPGTSEEWDVVYHAVTLMDGHLEYALLAGNHDYSSHLDKAFSKNKYYTTQFVERGGIYNYRTGLDENTDITSVSNSWCTLRVGEVDYLIMNLNYNTSDAVFDWANEILGREEFKDHHVIVSTHAYLNYDATTLDEGDSSCGTKTSGREMWLKLIENNANVKLVLSGHVDVDNIVYSQRKGANGNTVTQVLVNAQGLDPVFKGLNMIAMFNFSEDGSKLAIEYYSEAKDRYFKTASQVVLDLNADAPMIEEDAGWVGETIAPSGSGTKSDPYLISSGGNLVWMSKQITSGTTASLDGVYFEQTCDIDLNGFPVTSIGYYFASESEMAAFGGHYNGNGFSIKNGIIGANSKENPASIEHGYGLFGAIFGATIENVVLENVQVVGAGVTGGVVGIAASALVTDANYEGFNIISGCEIKDTVRIVATDIAPLSTANFDNADRGGRIGSVCGMAHGTVIQGCTSDANIVFGSDYGIVGGIVGTAGLNSKVSYCSFGGSITLYDNDTTLASSYGGIVGAVSPTVKSETAYVGALNVNNCYNYGSFIFDNSITELKSDIYFGGIIGSACELAYIAPSEENTYTYIVEKCYNLSVGPKVVDSTKQAIAGILGKAYAVGAESATVFLKNCSSVALDNAIGYEGTNEYRVEGAATTGDGYSAVNVIEVTTSAADELETMTAAIDTQIETIRNSAISIIWYTGSGAPAFVPDSTDIKYYDFSRKLYYLYDGTQWSLYGGIETEYGIIPESFKSVDDYPFIIFKNGVFAGAGDAWNTSKSAGVVADAIAIATDKNDVVTVVLRRNYDHVQTTNLNSYNELVGTLNVDLGGNTITTARELIQFNHKIANNIVNMNIYNGTITVTGRRLMAFQNQSSTIRQDLKLTFKDVTIDYRSSWSLVEGVDNTTGLCAADVIFEDCTIDLTSYSGSAFTFITASNDTNKAHLMHVVFKGGEFKSNVDFTGKLISKNTGYPEGEADTLKFEKNEEGNYTKFTMPTSLAAPTKTYDSTGLAYSKVSSDTENTTYELIETTLAGYGEIPEKYLDKELYPFLIFKNGVCVGAGDNWNTSKTAGVIPTAIGLTSDGSEVTVVLRRDFENRATATPNTYNQLVGTLNIDLGGNTLSSYREIMQFNHKVSAGTVNVNIKNGNIIMEGRRLVNLLNQSATVRQDLKLTFSDVNITTKTTWSMIEATDSVTGLCVADVIFENCTLDLTAHSSAFYIFGANKDTNNSHVMHVVFKGGKIISTVDFSAMLISRKTGYANGEADTLTFEKNTEGKYTQITMPTSLAAPTQIYNSTGLAYLKVSTDTSNATYELVENILAGYGEIPAKYLDKEIYPFLIFKDGVCVGAGDNWNTSKTAGVIPTAISLTSDGSEVTVVLRRDFENRATDAPNTYNQLGGALYIDLGGYTLTSYREIIQFNHKVSTGTVDINIKNGNIIMAGRRLVNLLNQSATVRQDLTLTFSGVNITTKTTWSIIEATDSVSGLCVADVIFENCTLDLTAHSSAFYIFVANNDTNNSHVMHVVFKGGKIISNVNFSAKLMSRKTGYANGEADSLTFEKDLNGNYTCLVMPSSVSAPATTTVYNTVDGAECVFVKVSENDIYVNYSLYPKVMVGYKIKTSVTLWSNFVYNIYIPKANVEGLTVNETVMEYEEVEIDGVVYYHVVVNLPAGETLSDIKVCVKLNSGNTTVDANWTLSVLNYTKSVINGSYDDTTKTLMKDMLVYASAAHTYFENTSDVAEKLSEVATLLEGYAKEMPTGEAKQPTDKTYFTDVAVYLGEVPSFRFTLAEGYTADDFTFKVGNRNATVIVSDGYVEVVMYAYMMLDDVTFTVKGTGVTESYNLYAYYTYAKTLNNANLTAIVEGLMKYSVSAKAYRESVTGSNK